MKKLLGTVLGAIAAITIVSLADWFAGTLYPLSGELDSADPDTTAAIIAGMPLPAKLLIVFGWFLAAFTGAWLALRVSDWRWSGWIVAVLVVAGGIVNILLLPHPLWMQGCAIVLPLLGGWIAGRLHHKPYPGEPLLG
ncbi:hypothetical protein G4G27_19490 [Sphingomonas sp. So64.6b]|uniref:hypothetical protein n=1 Tax=Sphingomonas sp. So64.6b TaxID=2997354 RepID=UPI001603A930|nr:hypothetical protein [Sphingomonas sp. So64.6b]QNA85918.1 hypothetical protein G4G27_19490 [Sphingomonas sp. So64.6b]